MNIMRVIILQKNNRKEVRMDKDIDKEEDQVKVQEVAIIKEDKIRIQKFTLNMDMETSFLLAEKLTGFKKV